MSSKGIASPTSVGKDGSVIEANKPTSNDAGVALDDKGSVGTQVEEAVDASVPKSDRDKIVDAPANDKQSDPSVEKTAQVSELAKTTSGSSDKEVVEGSRASAVPEEKQKKSENKKAKAEKKKSEVSAAGKKAQGKSTDKKTKKPQKEAKKEKSPKESSAVV